MSTAPQVQSQTLNYNKEINDILKNITISGNSSPTEKASNHYIKMTLETLLRDANIQFRQGDIKGNPDYAYPFIKKHNFALDVVPLPNATLLNKNSNQYEGTVIQGNTGLALELFSAVNKYSHNAFVPVYKVREFGLSDLIEKKDVINVSVQDKYTDPRMSKNKSLGDKTSIEVVNINCLLKNNKKNGLTEEQLKGYFPDYDKQEGMHVKYSNKNKITQTRNKQNPDFPRMQEQITMKVQESLLPTLTKEMCHYKECQLKNTEHHPLFSPQQHLNSMIKLYKKNPQQLKDAILQAGYVMQYSMNKLFSEDMSARTQEEHKKISLEKAPSNLPKNELNKAREYLDKGEIEKARTILEPEKEINRSRSENKSRGR